MAFHRSLMILALLAAGTASAQTPEDLIRQAQQFQKDGALPRAVDTYKAFLAKFPDHSQVTETWYHLAKCYDEQGLVDECINALTKSLAGKKGWRNRPDAFHMLGKQYASVKKFAEACAAFEKLLAEGAGLYEDEVLNLLGGYYALQGNYDQGAAKFHLLKLKKDSPMAEQAAYKLAALWIKAEKIDLAVGAIQDLAQAFPNNQQIPELLLRVADNYRVKKDYEKTISICEQLRARYPKNIETLAGTYLLGLCYRDKKDFAKAAEILDCVGKVREFRGRGLAAEALLASAEIHYADLVDLPKAMQRYEDAATFARDSDSDRKNQILEQCYFRLAEYHYKRKSWSVALEYYLLLRNLATNINIIGRILDCQKELGRTDAAQTVTATDVDTIKKRIADNPGTAIALEAEVFLLDRDLSDTIRRRSSPVAMAPQYEKLLKSYPKDVVSQEGMEPYILSQVGTCYAYGATRDDLAKSIAAYEKIIALDNSDKNPHRIAALESIALVAERAGDKPRAMKAYEDLFAITKAQFDAAKDDKALEKKTVEYLKSIATRADTDDMINKSIELCRRVIEEKGPLSDLSKDARYSMAELFYLKKDYSSAARTYREYVQIYGPKQGADGNVAGGPWNPAQIDEKVEQVYEAAARVAHSWYMQRNDAELKKAYEWIVANFPNGNKYMAEAQYSLAMEWAKGKAGQEKQNKRNLADQVWKNVVNPSMDFDSPAFKKSFHFWVRLSEDDPSNAVAYVKTAILRAGQNYSEVGEHQLAANVFAQYLALFPVRGERAGGGKRGSGGMSVRDDNYDTALYALGREYIALGNMPRLIETYKPYLTGHRDDRFRISGLKLLGFQCTKAKVWDQAIEAYATLLDEYGEPYKDARGQVAPLPPKMRLREATRGWDGLRMEAPKDLNLGEIRYALGFMYWKQENFDRCAQTLLPFLDDKTLEKNDHRATALFMAAQSLYRLFDYATGVKALQAIIRQHTKFDAIEEVYEMAAKGCVLSKQWDETEFLCKKFVSTWPNSGRRPRIEFHSAVALLGAGKTDKALADLRSFTQGEYDQALKADAHYHLGLHYASVKKDLEALDAFDKSLALYPRETTTLAAAKAAMRLRKWDRARDLLQTTTRMFPKGDPAVLAEARETLPVVLKELAKPK
jgi:tetratricopeptide (TPR) repeat protein